MSIQDFLNQFEDGADIHAPFTILWTEHGRGFGQYHFYTDEEGNIHIDNECDSRESIKRIMCRLIDNAILDDVPFSERKAQTEVETNNNEGN